MEILFYTLQICNLKKQREYRFPNPTITVFNALGKSSDERTTLQYHITGYALLPDKISIGGKERVRVNNVQFGRSTVYEALVELRVGKDGILDYLQSIADLTQHTDWISNLKQPYEINFPKFTNIAII